MFIKHILEASVGDERHHENGNRTDPFGVVRVTLPLFSVFNMIEGRTACDREPCGLRTLSMGRR